MKIKDLETPRITKGLRKFSKKKQRLYEKYLKIQNEKIYETHKNLFEKIKNNAEKIYYQGRPKVYQNDIRNTLKVMKKIIGKKKCKNDTFPKNRIIDKIEKMTQKLLLKSLIFHQRSAKSCI